MEIYFVSVLFIRFQQFEQQHSTLSTYCTQFPIYYPSCIVYVESYPLDAHKRHDMFVVSSTHLFNEYY